MVATLRICGEPTSAAACCKPGKMRFSSACCSISEMVTFVPIVQESFPGVISRVAGVGLDGEVGRGANGLPRWLRGRGGYLLSLAPTIFTFAPLRMKILTPFDSPVEGNDESASWT